MIDCDFGYRCNFKILLATLFFRKCAKYLYSVCGMRINESFASSTITVAGLQYHTHPENVPKKWLEKINRSITLKEPQVKK